MRASNRRLSILASAAPIFNRRGFSGTSISDILTATDLEKGGLYNHFTSKEELAIATFDYAFKQVDAYFTKALAGTESGLPRLRAYVDAFERYIERPVVNGGCPIANATLEADDALPFLRDRIATAFANMRGYLMRNIERGREKKHFRSDVDPEATADFIISALEGALLLSRGMRSRTPVKHVLALLRAWVEGLAA
ncbi:MAG: TetR/AcrR family transcriptional regulator [Candidatus Eremiobacteraeota bacterium]|nr:TetR/AcrR family transcriptional regulator [Candidatus Eremiobacteraeota bacterium]